MIICAGFAFAQNTITGALGSGLAPVSSVGREGDFFRDANSDQIWGPKTSGSWGGSPSYALVGQIPGTAAIDNAAAGNIGEYVEGTVAQASPTSLTTATIANLTSVALTAGDWNINCMAYFIPAASTNVASAVVSLAATNNATNETTPGIFDIQSPAGVPATSITGRISNYRIRLASSATYYCNVKSSFSVSTETVWGIMSARRAR